MGALCITFILKLKPLFIYMYICRFKNDIFPCGIFHFEMPIRNCRRYINVSVITERIWQSVSGLQPRILGCPVLFCKDYKYLSCVPDVDGKIHPEGVVQHRR